MKGYKTKQKESIYNYIKENRGGSFTVDELSDMLDKSGIKVGKTTVYRFLEALADKGEVKKLKTDDKKSVSYEILSDGCDDHYHLKCIDCGKLIHADCDILNELAKHFFDVHNFTVDNKKTVIYGKCEKCGVKNNA